LSASHIIPVGEKGGSDDTRNGLILCHNHHDAFDDFLFSIHPETNKIIFRSTGPFIDDLKIETKSLLPVKNMPHIEALRWHYQKFEENIRKYREKER
jgi:predicted restriction endonuclease